MPKTHPFRKLSIDEPLCQQLDLRKRDAGYKSLTRFVSKILNEYLQGAMVSPDFYSSGSPILATKVETIQENATRKTA